MSEHLFTAMGRGQSAETCIGGVVYERGLVYSDVPEDHVRRGGFLAHPLDLPKPEQAPLADGCIVIGAAPCWEDDLEAARKYVPDWPVVAVNTIGALYPDDIAVWVSVHGRDLLKWMPLRAERGYNTDYTAYGNFSDSEDDGGAVRWNRPNKGGSSGLHAVELAMEIGYKKLILCGMPMDGDQRCQSFDGAATQATCNYESYQSGWEKLYPRLKGKVRSMSGWTKALLGKPTKGWLK